jgi:hypothetical protein
MPVIGNWELIVRGKFDFSWNSQGLKILSPCGCATSAGNNKLMLREPEGHAMACPCNKQRFPHTIGFLKKIHGAYCRVG